MSTLSPPDRARLAKLLALLSSPHAGERDAAGLAAHRLVSASGATWEDVLQPPPEYRPTMAPHAAEAPPNHCHLVMWCIGHGGFLSKWERDFLHGLIQYGYLRRLSRKQQGVVDDIVMKIRVGLRGEFAA